MKATNEGAENQNEHNDQNDTTNEDRIGTRNLMRTNLRSKERGHFKLNQKKKETQTFMWPYRNEDTASVARTGDDAGANIHAREHAANDRGLGRDRARVRVRVHVRVLLPTFRCCCAIALRCAVESDP